MNGAGGRRWILLVLLGWTAGCFSPGKSAPPSFYVLRSTAGDSASAAGEATRTGSAIVVLPVEVPELLDRPQMVVRKGANQVEILEFDRWAEPLEDGVLQVLLDDLAALLPTRRFYRGETTPPAGEHLMLQVRIERFEPGPDGAVHLRAWWGLSSNPEATAPVETHSDIREPIQGGLSTPSGTFDAGAAVEAMNRALASLAGEIASEVREKAP